MIQPDMIRIKGDGVTLQAADWPGRGRPILAVHGITANCMSFAEAAQGLSPAHRVIALDLRGRGLSDKPASGYSIDRHCRDMEQALANLGLDRVNLMGHSLGAYIGLCFAATRPHLVEKLILLDGGATLSPEQWSKVTIGIKPSLDRLGKVFDSFEDYIGQIKKAPFLQPWVESLENMYRYESEPAFGGVRSRIRPENIDEERANVIKFDAREYYGKVKCPVLILRAPEGMLAPDQLVLPTGPAQALVRDIPRAQLVDLPGTNHFSLILHPNRERDRVILDFLAE